MARHTSSLTPADAVTGVAGDQPGACPVLDGEPTRSDLPVDQDTGNPVPLFYLDASVGIVKVTSPDGAGGVATATVVSLATSISLGGGDTTGLL